MSATSGDLTMVESSALAIQLFRGGMEVSMYVDRRIVLRVMVSNARSGSTLL
jgi:hypothetical protein